MKEDLLKKLNNKNYRVTQARVDVLECLNDDVHSHTIKDIVKHLNNKGKKVNVTSVYNTIKLLINEGIVDIYTDYDNKNQVFEIIDKNKLHIHLYDRKNNQENKFDMPENIINEINNFINEKGYNADNIKIEILASKKD